jgi:hypothetical protein
MNARITKAELIAATERLLTENAQLRQLNAEWAADAARLKRELLKAKGQSSANFGASRAVSAYTDAVRAYCELHGVKSCTKADLVREGLLHA